MQVAKQLALFLENRPGTLSRVCDALAREKINIYAMCTSDTVDHMVLRLVVSDTARAMHLFQEHGALVVETDVLMIEDSNKPGTLRAISQKLAEANINIDYIYFATSPKAQKGLCILRTHDIAEALKVLNS